MLQTFTPHTANQAKVFVVLSGYRKVEMSKLEISKNSHAGWRHKNLLRQQDRRLQLHRS